MQALSDEQQMDRLETKVDRIDQRVDRLETKVDDGFAAIRSETREDFRLLLGVLRTMFMAMILGFTGILLQQAL
jgi:tetrahydromethanopterin S-methyltransferase subunit B